MENIGKSERLQHLYWRAGFGATPVQLLKEARPVQTVVKEMLTQSDFQPLVVVDADHFQNNKTLKKLAANGKPDRDATKMRIKKNAGLIRDLNVLWVEKMASGEDVLREKMALFWHGHFACRVLNPAAVQRYLNTIRTHALSNFADLLMAVSKEPAMLQFLNNQQNRKGAPNENFAREVMELFALGRASQSYTEADIKDAARAFTGWGYNPKGEFTFRQNQHDDGLKTIFGQTGYFKGEDVVRLLLEKKQTAHFVTGKIYQFLVSDQADSPEAQTRIKGLAEKFYKSGYDIAGLLNGILTANWFYEPSVRGNRIKSPVELLAGMQHSLGLVFQQKQSLIFIQRTLGQVLLYPPNVAGWPGGRNWIDSSSLLFRMKLPDLLLRSRPVTMQPKQDGDVNTELLARREGDLMQVQIDWDAFERSFSEVDPDRLADALAAYLIQQPLGKTQRAVILQMADGSSRGERIRNLTVALMALPEYQLC
ncbi:MAG: hypothetical protein BGO21_02450 [Dyadobacter sp. 50-39]|uniref:DUF1800 domain-containing protein n=1 Tax=Dyadobacter sp. 50-39 TaxID=1895756 RepID=UPI00095A8142|nr:DUF1800 domain-containing protein [Dyadobacter sp. 50-39]OJV12626.1 MAG: hypothetical protein BGO21_02450 [Dyadobacter sp. 50-39]